MSLSPLGTSSARLPRCEATHRRSSATAAPLPRRLSRSTGTSPRETWRKVEAAKMVGNRSPKLVTKPLFPSDEIPTARCLGNEALDGLGLLASAWQGRPGPLRHVRAQGREEALQGDGALGHVRCLPRSAGSGLE